MKIINSKLCNWSSKGWSWSLSSEALIHNVMHTMYNVWECSGNLCTHREDGACSGVT